MADASRSKPFNTFPGVFLVSFLFFLSSIHLSLMSAFDFSAVTFSLAQRRDREAIVTRRGLKLKATASDARMREETACKPRFCEFFDYLVELGMSTRCIEDLHTRESLSFFCFSSLRVFFSYEQLKNLTRFFI